MDLISDLKSKNEPAGAPKFPVSAYLTKQQKVRLETICKRSGLSLSAALGGIVDFVFEEWTRKQDKTGD